MQDCDWGLLMILIAAQTHTGYGEHLLIYYRYQQHGSVRLATELSR